MTNEKIKELVRILLAHSKLPLNVVYDVDDVMNGLNEYAFKKLGFSWRPRRFNIRECTEIPKEQQDALLAVYQDTQTFRELEWKPGAYNITDVEKTGKALVWINSNSFGFDIRDVKRHRILTELTEVNPSRIILQVKSADEKEPIQADIIIEDNITNCLKYPEWAIKILVNNTWNQPNEYPMDEDKLHIIRVDTLLEANELVNRIISYID